MFLKYNFLLKEFSQMGKNDRYAIATIGSEFCFENIFGKKLEFSFQSIRLNRLESGAVADIIIKENNFFSNQMKNNPECNFRPELISKLLSIISNFQPRKIVKHNLPENLFL